jgi:general secretion pathway protein I
MRSQKRLSAPFAHLRSSFPRKAGTQGKRRAVALGPRLRGGDGKRMRFVRSAAERAAGFTLLEVLVAFAIAGVALVPLLRIFSGGLISLGRTERTERATLWAESVLGARDGEAPPAIGVETGDLPDGYRWRRTVTFYGGILPAGQVAPLVPYDVTMTVSWQERGRTRAVTLETLMLGPPIQYQVR